MKRYCAWGFDGPFRFKWQRDFWVWRRDFRKFMKENADRIRSCM